MPPFLQHQQVPVRNPLLALCRETPSFRTWVEPPTVSDVLLPHFRDPDPPALQGVPVAAGVATLATITANRP